MKKPKWVRGKALQTVIGLNAMQVGDELLVRPRDGRFAHKTSVWSTTRKTTITKFKYGSPFVACRCDKCKKHASNLVIAAEEIQAWRRPLVDK